MEFNTIEELKSDIDNLQDHPTPSEIKDLLDIAYHMGTDDGETTGYRNSMEENRWDDQDEESIRDEAYQEGYRDAEMEGERTYKDGYDNGYENGRKDGYSEGSEDGYNEGYEDGKAGV